MFAVLRDWNGSNYGEVLAKKGLAYSGAFSIVSGQLWL
jgi:hypothetical protein